MLDRGLSPRVRGNPFGERYQMIGAGSIPACAGEPCRKRIHCSSRAGSIPACAGEPPLSREKTDLAEGLSPRVRGNQICDRR